MPLWTLGPGTLNAQSRVVTTTTCSHNNDDFKMKTVKENHKHA